MNALYTQIKTITTKRDLCRHFSPTATRNAWKKNSCEEKDCCGNPTNAEPKPIIYIERSCHPCSFMTWKPRIPILKSAPPLMDVRKKTYKKKHCYAGMKVKEKSMEEIKKEVAECEKRCAAKPVCPSFPPPPTVTRRVRPCFFVTFFFN